MHSSDFSSITLCIVCASNYTQTIHKLYIEAFKTLHERWGKPYTERYIEAFKTLHETTRKPPALQRCAVYLGAHLSEIRRRLILSGCAPSFS